MSELEWKPIWQGFKNADFPMQHYGCVLPGGAKLFLSQIAGEWMANLYLNENTPPISLITYGIVSLKSAKAVALRNARMYFDQQIQALYDLGKQRLPL